MDMLSLVRPTEVDTVFGQADRLIVFGQAY